MKLLKRLSCFIVAMSVAISCASCSTGDTTWAFDYEGTRINSGLYIGLSISAYIQASYQVEDYTKDILTQYVEEQPAKDWILNKTRELADRYAVVESEFDRLGLELSDDDMRIIEAELNATWDSSGSIYEANGVGKNSYRQILTNSKKEEALFDGYYGVGGTDEVTQDEMFEYFKEEYAVINVMTVSKEMEVSFDETEGEEHVDVSVNEDIEIINEERHQQLLDYAQRINDGESFNEIYIEYEAELEAQLAAEEQELQDLIAETGETLNTEEVEEVEEEVEEGNDVNEIEETDSETATSEDEVLSDIDEDELQDGDNTDEVDDQDTDIEDETTDNEDEDENETVEDEDETSPDSDENTDETDVVEIEEEVSSDELPDEPQIQDDEETKFAFSKSSSTPSTSFIETLFGFEANGKAEVIDDGMSYYLIIRYEVEEGDARFEDKIDSLVMEMKSEEYTEKVDALVETMAPTSINDASITRYDPKNIQL